MNITIFTANVLYQLPSNPVRVGLFGEEEKQQVVELNRLWVNESVPKNGESFLIGNTLKLVPFEIIVSYADTKQNHLGIVYQATNWLYYGLTDKHVQWNIQGTDAKHCRHIFDKYGGVNKTKEALGDKLIKSYRDRKHRYLFLNCNKRRKKELLKKFRYTFKPYPKRIKEQNE
ncbi:MAG: Mom family adenine methylcarbamoylation protein [Candidatus Heimdallarchaeaceae archaeon]